MRYEDCPRNHGSACVNCSYGIDEDTKYFLLNVNEIIYVQINKFGILFGASVPEAQGPTGDRSSLCSR